MTVTESFGFVLTGFGLVLATLALLWLVSATIGRLFASGTRRRAEAPAAPPQLASARAIPPGHIAAIGGAVAVLIGSRGRVVRIRAPGHVAPGWSSEGRSENSASHGNRVRWDRAAPGPTHTDKHTTGTSAERRTDGRRTR